MELKKELTPWKILLLDIDGVLNSTKFLKESGLEDIEEGHLPHIDPKKMAIIRRVLEQVPELRIVLSSSWNATVNLEDYKSMFDSYQINPELIIGKTSDNRAKRESILEWLDTNRPTSFVIIDDDMLFDLDEELSFHQFKTRAYIGLQESDESIILEMLQD